MPGGNHEHGPTAGGPIYWGPVSPPVYQELNRTVLERTAPGVVERVKAKWPRKLLRERRF